MPIKHGLLLQKKPENISIVLQVRKLTGDDKGKIFAMKAGWFLKLAELQ